MNAKGSGKMKEMRRLKVPGRVIGCEVSVVVAHMRFSNDTSLPDLPGSNIPKLAYLTNFLSTRLPHPYLVKPPQASDADKDGRDKAGMEIKPYQAPEQEIRRALLLYLTQRPHHNVIGRDLQN